MRHQKDNQIIAEKYIQLKESQDTTSEGEFTKGMSKKKWISIIPGDHGRVSVKPTHRLNEQDIEEGTYTELAPGVWVHYDMEEFVVDAAVYTDRKTMEMVYTHFIENAEDPEDESRDVDLSTLKNVADVIASQV